MLKLNWFLRVEDKVSSLTFKLSRICHWPKAFYLYFHCDSNPAPQRDPLSNLRKPRGTSNLVGKDFRSGFYWPTALADARDIVKRCPGCQFFSKQQHVPAQALQMIPSSWPFACWGLDSVGLLKPAQGGYTHIFTKWIEVKPVTTTSAVKAAEFIKEITHRFGVPVDIS